MNQIVIIGIVIVLVVIAAVMFLSGSKGKEEEGRIERSAEPADRSGAEGKKPAEPERTAVKSAEPEKSAKPEKLAEPEKTAEPEKPAVSEKSAEPETIEKTEEISEAGKPEAAAIKSGASESAKTEERDVRKDIYQYINQALKKMHRFYMEDRWEELQELGALPEDFSAWQAAVDGLCADSSSLLRAFFECVRPESGEIGDGEALREVFLSMMLPFYPVYYKTVGKEIRYSSLLNKKTLYLFRELTGRRFNLGHKNRYANGVTAFRWNKDVYQIYDKDGTMLCDASFRDGKIYSGYAVVPEESEPDGDWSVVKTGTYEEGSFREEAIRYIYRKPVH